MDGSNHIYFSKRNNIKNGLRKEILEALPLNLRAILSNLSLDIGRNLEEIRLRVHQPLMVYARNQDYFLNEQGEAIYNLSKAYRVTQSDIDKTYQLITDYSVYALEEEIRNGFITIRGGHRVGICGRTILTGKTVKTLKDISALNIRISRQKIGISDPMLHHLVDPPHHFYNTLIVSPPQCGKTTLLRDIIRNLSNGMKDLNVAGFKVGVVDERSEICAVYQGIPQNDVGIRTDVLDSCPKAEGMMMLIRSMSPQIIATDEIGKQEDVLAIEEALHAGVKVIATVHGYNLTEIYQRPYLKSLMEQQVFKRIIILSNYPHVGTIKEVIYLPKETRPIMDETDGRCESVG